MSKTKLYGYTVCDHPHTSKSLYYKNHKNTKHFHERPHHRQGDAERNIKPKMLSEEFTIGYGPALEEQQKQ